MRWRRLVCVLALVVPCAFVTGCVSDVTGLVVSQTTGSAIPSATVTCGGQTVSTDASGTFSLIAVKNGPQTVSAAADGYPSVSQNIKISKSIKPITIRLADCILTGKVREVAVQRTAVASGTVTVGNIQLPIAKDGSFSIAGVRPGDTTITIESPNRITRDTAISLRPGENSIEVTLSIDLKETYTRFNQAEMYGRWDVAYKYMHPDVRALESLKKFKKDNSVTGTIISLKLGATRPVRNFHSKYTGKTYPTVTQIDRQIVNEYPGYGTLTDNTAQHWELRSDGMWYFIWNFPRE